MPECNPLNLGCQAKQFALDGFEQIADWCAQWAATMLTSAMTWWVETETINPDSEAVETAQGYTMPVIGIILMCSVLAQCIRIVLQRKLQPVLDVGLGVARYVLVTTMGLTLLGGAVAAGDAFAQWMLNTALMDFNQQLQSALNIMNRVAPGSVNPFTILILSLFLGLFGAIQWLLGFIRQAGIVILAVMLPLAAAGSLSQMGKDWLSKLLPWLIALVAYKPMAALIYVIGFELFGTTGEVEQGQTWKTLMVGIMVLLMAIVALPVMMKFFSWAGTTVPSGGGGSALGSMASMAGSPSGAAPRSPGQQQASYMDTNGPGQGPAASGAAASSSSSGTSLPGPSGPSGPSGGAASTQGSTASSSGQAARTGAQTGTNTTQASTAGTGSGGAAAGAAGGAAGGSAAVGMAAYQGTQKAASETGSRKDQQ